MKTLNLFGLMIAAACTFQACHSPESRGSMSDSSAKDSSATDSAGAKSDSSSGGGANPKDVTNMSKVDGDEATFMTTAAVGGMMEVEAGKIAQKSSNPKVKAFAAQMVADHTKANNELKALATDKKIILPSEFPADEKAHLDAMKNMKGADFDKHYIDMMVTDHDKTIALFNSGASSQDKAVSDFAKKTIPVITGHYEKAKEIQASLK